MRPSPQRGDTYASNRNLPPPEWNNGHRIHRPLGSTRLPGLPPRNGLPAPHGRLLEIIRGYGSEITEPAGTAIYARGERGTDMFVVLAGRVNVYIGSEENTTETVIDLGDHQFTGELNMLNDQPTLVGARTTVPSVLLRVTRDGLRRLMRAEGEIANLILQAFIWRRIGLASQTKVGVTLIGHEGGAETIKLQRFLRRNGYPHHVASVEAYTISSGLAPLDADSWPAVVFSDGRVLHRPTVSKLADELGISELPDKDIIYDVAVVGAGPAGLAAAVYASSEGLSTVVIEGTAPGGQAGTSSKIETISAFPPAFRTKTREPCLCPGFEIRRPVRRLSRRSDARTLRRWPQDHPRRPHFVVLPGGCHRHRRTVSQAAAPQLRDLRESGHLLCGHRHGDCLLSRQGGRSRRRWQLRRASCSVSRPIRRPRLHHGSRQITRGHHVAISPVANRTITAHNDADRDRNHLAERHIPPGTGDVGGSPGRISNDQGYRRPLRHDRCSTQHVVAQGRRSPGREGLRHHRRPKDSTALLTQPILRASTQWEM